MNEFAIQAPTGGGYCIIGWSDKGTRTGGAADKVFWYDSTKGGLTNGTTNPGGSCTGLTPPA